MRIRRELSQRIRDRLLSLGRVERRTPRADVELVRASEYPHPYPEGWYALARSSELGPDPLRVDALGRSFVVFRGESGEAHVLDSTCPHQGADLSLGRVRGECIECPFHRWTFDGEGQVTHIPYNDSLKKTMRTRAWHVDESYGFVNVYLSSPDAERHRLPRFDAIDAGDLVWRGDYDAGIVRMHLVEFAENSVDFQHFTPLHGEMFVPWTGIRVPGIQIRHEASWELDAKESHVAWFKNHARLELRGREVKGADAKAAICIAGPGGIVSFHFDVPRMGKIVLFQTHTPEAPLEQRVRFRWYAEPHIPRVLVEYVVGSWVTQWRQDVAIWESKRYQKRPMLVKGDGPVHLMRRWYSRFLPDAPPPPSGSSSAEQAQS